MDDIIPKYNMIKKADFFNQIKEKINNYDEGIEYSYYESEDAAKKLTK